MMMRLLAHALLSSFNKEITFSQFSLSKLDVGSSARINFGLWISLIQWLNAAFDLDLIVLLFCF